MCFFLIKSAEGSELLCSVESRVVFFLLIYIYVYIYIYIYIHIYINIYNICVYVYRNIYIGPYIHVYIYILCVCVCVCARARVCSCLALPFASVFESYIPCVLWPGIRPPITKHKASMSNFYAADRFILQTVAQSYALRTARVHTRTHIIIRRCHHPLTKARTSLSISNIYTMYYHTLDQGAAIRLTQTCFELIEATFSVFL